MRFEAGKLGNVFWIMDQVSRWDPDRTDPAYRDYWSKRIGGLTSEDDAVLAAYGKVRRKLSLDAGSTASGSQASRVFSGVAPSAGDRFLAAFVSRPTLGEASAALSLPVEDAKELEAALAHFAGRILPFWGEEYGPLEGFVEMANSLSDFSMPGEYVEEMRQFFGVPESVGDAFRIHVLWAPPEGTVAATHVGTDILLPVSTARAGSDIEVLSQTGAALREVAAFLLASVSDDTRTKAEMRILASVGHVDPRRPRAVAEALCAAFGDRFLTRSFPDLRRPRVLIPFDLGLVVPHALDELARKFAAALPDFDGQTAAFFPKFVDRAVEIQSAMFPPAPRSFAGTALVLADEDGRYFFGRLFSQADGRMFPASDAGGFVKAASTDLGRPLFLIVKTTDEAALWEALKGLNLSRDLAREIRKYGSDTLVYPILSSGRGPVFVVRGRDTDGIRRALISLFNMRSMLTTPMVIK
jgi:hypothetical protein